MSQYFCRPSQAKFRKNTIFIDQSAFSNFALCVIIAKRSSNKVAPDLRGTERIPRNAFEAVEPTVEATLRSSREAAENIQNDDEGFKARAKRIRPKKRYTFSGTLSLTMTVYVMNDKGQHDKRACFTGPTHDSEKLYTISEDFKNLDVS